MSTPPHETYPTRHSSGRVSRNIQAYIQFVRISLTETVENAPAWSIQSLRVYGVR